MDEPLGSGFVELTRMNCARSPTSSVMKALTMIGNDSIRVSNRRRPLLAVDDPPRLVLVVEWDHEFPGARWRGLCGRDSNRTRSSKATTIPFGIIGDGDSRYERIA